MIQVFKKVGSVAKSAPIATLESCAAGLRKRKSYVDVLGRMFSLLLNEISYKSRFPVQRVMGNVSFRQSKFFCSEISTWIIFLICR